MGFQLQHKSMTLNDLERQFTALSSVLCVATKWLKLESCSFHYKVALYHSLPYLTLPLGQQQKPECTDTGQ